MTDTPAEESDPAGGKPQCCGLIMPIADWGDYTAKHWSDVQTILKAAVAQISDPPLIARLVSQSDAAGIIHRRIVRNVWENPIVICDVSGRNPNVLFELGMRIAFDRKVVIVKDDKTDFSFDTGPIEHVMYPRDLRHGDVEAFKTDLAAKVRATLLANNDDVSYVKAFGEITIVTPPTSVQTEGQAVMSVLRELQDQVTSLTARVSKSGVLTGGLSFTLKRNLLFTIEPDIAATDFSSIRDVLLASAKFMELSVTFTPEPPSNAAWIGTLNASRKEFEEFKRVVESSKVARLMLIEKNERAA